MDNYVLNTKASLLGMEGMRLRVLVRARLEEEAVAKEEAAKALRAQEKENRKLGLTSAAAVPAGAVDLSSVSLPTLNASSPPS